MSERYRFFLLAGRKLTKKEEARLKQAFAELAKRVLGNSVEGTDMWADPVEPELLERFNRGFA